MADSICLHFAGRACATVRLPDGLATPVSGERFVVVAEWGMDIGTFRGAHVPPPGAAATPAGGSSPRPPVFRRVATAADLTRQAENDKLAESALKRFAALLQEGGVLIKPLSAHYTLERERLRLVFGSSSHVDCRRVVGRMQKELQTRIEVWHAGVRDEAARLGGLGTCGRPLCCATWMHECRTVNIRMAKAQDCAINPAAVNGCCGRLKCCLRFEYTVRQQGESG
jgi:hypothetical protein